MDVLPGIFTVANATGQFTTLLSLIQSAGLLGQLNIAGPFTVFAPTDTAFANIENLDEITNDSDAVSGILANHVVGGKVTSDAMTDGQTLKTLVQVDLEVSVDGDTIMIEDATVIQPDIMGSNGVVHAIDGKCTLYYLLMKKK